MESGVFTLEWAVDFSRTLLGILHSLPAPALLGMLCVPVILAAFSRSRLGIAGAAILTLLTIALLPQASRDGTAHGLALLAYAGALLMAMIGYEAARRRRHLCEQAQEMERLRKEMRAFLEALDRRAQAVDRAAAIQSGPIPSGEGGGAGSGQAT